LAPVPAQGQGDRVLCQVKDNWWLEVREFVESTDKERIVEFKLPKKDRKNLEGYPQMWQETIKCRLIKVELENGETEILCTSLLDKEKYAEKEFESLYHYRWDEEETYKLLKSRAELEKFSGKTAKAVKQDFHAKVFLLSMCAAFSHPIEDKVIAEYKAGENRKYPQKINRTSAVANTMDMLIPMFIKRKSVEALKVFIISFINLVK
jgi:hypothetical protein